DERFKTTLDIAQELKQIREEFSQSQARSQDLPPIAESLDYRNRAVMKILAILVVIAAVALFGTRIRHSLENLLQVTPVPAEQLVAILPFTNVGADPISQPFCDGLVEVLTTKLTELQVYNRGLHIVPPTEIRREGITSARDALKSFGANIVVTGSIQRGAEKVRLTINVVDSKTMQQLNATALDAVIRDVSVLQDGIVIRVGEMVGLRLNSAAKEAVLSGGTTEPGAYDYYVQGRGYLQRFEQLESVNNAIELFQRATAREPQYTLAYAALGEDYWRKYIITKVASLI